MLTTLSITSMNQGKIAPRYDQEPRSAGEWAELAEPKAVARGTRISLFNLGWHFSTHSPSQAQQAASCVTIPGARLNPFAPLPETVPAICAQPAPVARRRYACRRSP